jgi:2,3-bisphosphoglycerate-independent phosphoglycerate mutase
MVTHDLVLRGVEFDQAYAISRAIRDELGDRDRVTTAEIRDLIERQLEAILGPDVPAALLAPVKKEPAAMVLHEGREQPFSRGLLASSLRAAGIETDRAYRLVTELEALLRSEGVKVVSSGDLARRVDDLLEEHEGVETARRYRLVRRAQRLPRPVVLFMGGASGTGKSTLALEIAPLLQIHRVSSSDTIRQVMRMVFTPAMLPSLHSSSFEVTTGPERIQRRGSAHDPEYAERLVASFDEQATRVAVGIRAVVERAITENFNLLVEGVHVHPDLMPFTDLEGSAYQVALMLSTLDEEAHRSRFLARARTSGRLAERYLERFDSIRVVHDHLVHAAEARGVPLLDTSEGEPPVVGGLRVVTGLLNRNWPDLGQAIGEEVASTPTLLLVIDGLADRPVRALGGRTPLAAANTPTLDRLAREGQCGLADSISPGVTADTAAGTLALFGQSPMAMKRGPVEALGSEVVLRPGDVALRGNFATLDEDGQVIDRRAGRIRGEEAASLAAAIDRLQLPRPFGSDVEVRVALGTEHRLAIVIRGKGLSSAIQGSDPGDGAPVAPPRTPMPDDPADDRAVFTARVLAVFEQEARRILARQGVNRRRIEAGLPPANCILTRGAGRLHELVRLEEAGLPLRLACVSGDRTVLGVAGWLGARILSDEKMTANLDTDLALKFETAAAALEYRDLVLLHVKGADIASHDRRPDLKVAFLEAVDEQLGALLDRSRKTFRVAVASDHATLSESGQHAADPLPVLIWGKGIEADRVDRFDEQAVSSGALGRFPLQLLLSRLFRLS